jgi:hypothetical protein
MTRVAKWKAIVMDRERRPRGSCGETASSGQIFIFGYLQFFLGRWWGGERGEERERAPARGTVFNWMFQQWPENTVGCPRVA